MLAAVSSIFSRSGLRIVIFCLVSFFPATASIPDTFTEGNFQILLPDGWGSDASAHPYKLNNGDETKVVLINPVPISVTSLDQPGQDLKMAQASGPGFVSSYGRLTISGVNFIVYDKQLLDLAHKGILYQRGYYTEGNGYGITILTQTLNGALPQNDAEIMGLINSFSFDTMPASPSPAPHRSDGGFAPLLLGGSGVLVILALIFFFVWRQRSPGRP
jgi:hypothetical protein